MVMKTLEIEDKQTSNVSLHQLSMSKQTETRKPRFHSFVIVRFSVLSLESTMQFKPIFQWIYLLIVHIKVSAFRGDLTSSKSSIIFTETAVLLFEQML
jgi:hypothetical protein